MPERGFASETWDSDEWFQELTERLRYLFIYLWTNGHCNQAGLYHITLTTISFATKIPKDELPDLIRALEPKVKWWPEENLIWVKNFLKRQSKSSKFLAAAAKSLTTITNPDAIQELLDYNMRRYSISIPYQYYIDRISILTRVSVPVPNTVSGSGPEEKKGVVKGEEEPIPRSRAEAEETLYGGDQEIISVWYSVKGFNMTSADASALVAKLRTEFPDLDLLAESKTWAARKLNEPLLKGSKPSQQIWNWMRLARKYAQERRDRGKSEGQRTGPRPREAFRGGKW